MVSERKKILVINEDVDFCILMRHFHQRKNYEVFIAHNADDAVEALQQNPPDFIMTAGELQGLEKVKRQAAISAPNARFIAMGKDPENDNT